MYDNAIDARLPERCPTTMTENADYTVDCRIIIIIIIIRNLYSAIMPLGGYRGAEYTIHTLNAISYTLHRKRSHADNDGMLQTEHCSHRCGNTLNNYGYI